MSFDFKDRAWWITIESYDDHENSNENNKMIETIQRRTVRWVETFLLLRGDNDDDSGDIDDSDDEVDKINDEDSENNSEIRGSIKT